MSYKIVIDSCGELLDEWKKDPRFESVALTLSVGGENIIDDENFDQASFFNCWEITPSNIANLPSLTFTFA